MAKNPYPPPGTKAYAARIKARQEADCALIEAGAFSYLGVPETVEVVQEFDGVVTKLTFPAPPKRRT